MRKFACVVVALLSAGSAMAANTEAFNGNWVLMHHQQEPNETAYADYSYDTNSFTKTGDKVSFWEQMVLASPPKDFKVITIAHMIVNCETQQAAQIAFAVSKTMGAYPSSTDLVDTQPEYKSYPPNSPGAKVLKYVCNVPAN
jgi:hypothetical protein